MITDVTDIEVVLIDGDIIINKAAYSCQQTWYTHPDMGINCTSKKELIDSYNSIAGGELDETKIVKTVDVGSINDARTVVDNLISDILDTIGVQDHIIVCGPDSGTITWRHELYPEYKANRGEKPVLFKDVRDYVLSKHQSFKCPLVETDDMLGVLSEDYKHTSIIASIDKDLLQLPCYHYNIDTKHIYNGNVSRLWIEKLPSGSKKLRGTGEIWFFAQMLLGDKVDNIKPPKKGCGDVFVYNILLKAYASSSDKDIPIEKVADRLKEGVTLEDLDIAAMRRLIADMYGENIDLRILNRRLIHIDRNYLFTRHEVSF